MKKLSSHHCAWWEGGDSNSGPDYRPQGLLPLWSEGSHSDCQYNIDEYFSICLCCQMGRLRIPNKNLIITK